MNSEYTFIRIYNDFTKNLLVNYSNGKNNLVLSPFSILVLLCMAADSTDSETRKEVINVINLRRKTHALACGMKAAFL